MRPDASFLRVAARALVLAVLVVQVPAHAEDDETVVADSGFRPDVDGLPFPNFGESPNAEVRAEDLRRVFGDVVCGSTAGGECALTPQAQEWLEVVNSQSKTGHCYGFSELSLLAFAGRFDVSRFGAESVRGLVLDGNELLQRELKILWSTQFSPSVVAATKGGPPSKLLAVLRDVFREGRKARDLYTVGFSRREGGGGHAVTPFALEDRDEDTVALLVYDNNWPGERKEMIFDLAKETWKYNASVNPAEPEGAYDGDARTASLWLMPATNGKYPQPWGFAPEKPGLGSAPEPAFNEIWLDGDDENRAHLLLTDRQGRRTGFVDGKLVNDIPGAKVVHSIGGDLFPHSEPVYFVPTTVDFTVTLDGRRLTSPATANLSLIGPGRTIQVDGVHLDPGQVDTIAMTGDGRSVSYTTKGGESPNLVLGIENAGADYEFTIGQVTLGHGGTVSLLLDKAKSRLVVGFQADLPGTFAYVMTRIDETGAHEFDDEGVEWSPTETLSVDYGSWDGTPRGTIEVTIDKGDGKPQSARLENEKK